MPDRYGFEIVHGGDGRDATPALFAKQNIRSSIENLRQIKPFKFYTVVKPEIYPQLIRRMMIARLNRDGDGALQYG
jgi:hypothetical protein